MHLTQELNPNLVLPSLGAAFPAQLSPLLPVLLEAELCDGGSCSTSDPALWGYCFCCKLDFGFLGFFIIIIIFMSFFSHQLEMERNKSVTFSISTAIK